MEISYVHMTVVVLVHVEATGNNRLIDGIGFVFFYSRPCVRCPEVINDKKVQGIGFVASLYLCIHDWGHACLVSVIPGKANRFLNLSSNCPSTVKVLTQWCTETRPHA